MRLLRNFLLLAIALMSLNSSYAQVLNPTKWTYEVKNKGNNTYDLVFHLKLDKHWHVWSFNPGGDGMQIPPSFNFDKNAAVTLVGKTKEVGKMRNDVVDGVDGKVNFFEDAVDYIQTVKVTGNTTIAGKHEFQVCDPERCLPPTKKPFSFSITDATGTRGSDTTSTAVNQGLDTAGAITVMAGDSMAEGADTMRTAIAPVAGGNDGNSTALASTQDCNPGSTFLSGFGNGLLSVITPCVFAMLPMTVSFFLKRSKDRKTGIKIALQYSLSIVFIFTVIGGLLSLLLGPDALHAFSTNWVVNVVFFAIFLVFGISFLGAFEINLPSSWATKMDSKANTKNFLGIFFMALTLVIVSFSCTVPFIGNTVVALQGSCKTGPLFGFLGFGLGLALPFSLFAIFPSLLNELGKSGGWLNVVKVVFGFVELGLAMKFLSNADLQRDWHLLDREIFIAIWIGLSFVLGIYLLGLIRFSHDSELPKNDWGLTYLKVPRLFFAMGAIIFGFYLIPGMWGAPLNGMGAFIPPMGTQDFVLSAGGSGGHAVASDGDGPMPVKHVDKMKRFEPATVINFHLRTFYDYDEALAASKAAKKPVMLDFTGINCANCRKFESEVWSHPGVLSRMKNDFIIASLFTDVQGIKLPKEEQRYSEKSNRDIETLGDKNVDLQITKFNSNTQPFYFFVDENGTVLADKGVAYPTKPEAFIQHLDKVKARYKELHGE